MALKLDEALLSKLLDMAALEAKLKLSLEAEYMASSGHDVTGDVIDITPNAKTSAS